MVGRVRIGSEKAVSDKTFSDGKIESLTQGEVLDFSDSRG